jgi:hypothetical protein
VGVSSDENKIVPFPGAAPAGLAPNKPAPAAPGAPPVTVSSPAPGVTITVTNLPAEPEEPHPADVEGAGEDPAPPAESPAAVGDDPGEAFATEEGLREYYFDQMVRLFWMKNPAAEWVDLNETQFKRELRKLGLRAQADIQAGQPISQLDEKLRTIEQNHRVAYAGLLAGYRAGLHVVTGRRVLVTEDPLWIEPREGDWPTLAAFFEGLLCGHEPLDEKGGFKVIDQRDHFYAWLQHAVQCYYDCRIASGLALAIAGEPDCGKSFLTWILRQIFGGRVGKPYAAMTGQDNFNKDAAEAVLQLVDDENQADTKLDMRQKFASEIKKFVANNEFRLRAMHKDGFSVEVLRRLVILVNLQGILVLPPLDGDVDDKLMIFKGYTRPRPQDQSSWLEGRPTLATPYEQACWPAPMPTRTEQEKEAYRARVRAELPAFLWWLLKKFVVPSRVSGGRFVVRYWHHPAIVAELHDMSPHVRLWDLIVRSQCVFKMDAAASDPEAPAAIVDRDEWRGTASELEDLLRNSTRSKLSADEKREIKAANWLGKRLDLCEKHLGSQFCHQEKTRLKRIWVLKPRPEDKGETK